ncbi:unnamed protein product [Closterium sp. NIES-64]|nr:unnamed protein product [Closterium sp. NIES-64]
MSLGPLAVLSVVHRCYRISIRVARQHIRLVRRHTSSPPLPRHPSCSWPCRADGWELDHAASHPAERPFTCVHDSHVAARSREHTRRQLASYRTGWVGETWAGAGSVGVRGGEGAGGRDGKRDERARATNGVEGSPSSFVLTSLPLHTSQVSSVEQDLPDDPLRAKYIQGTLVPDALSYLSRLLSVRVLPPDPLLLPVTCAAFTALSNGTSACTQLAPTMCDVTCRPCAT